MDWIDAWEKANRDLSEASKLYDQLRMMPMPARHEIGRQDYEVRRRQALERFKTADQTCTKLKQMTRRSRYKPRSQVVI